MKSSLFTLFFLVLTLEGARAQTAIAIPTASPTLPTTLPSAPVTHSALYQSFEHDSPSRLAFIQDHNQATLNSLQASQNYIPVQNLIFQIMSPQSTLKAVALDAARTLKLVDRGLERSTDLVLSTTGANDVTLVSNFQLFGVTVVDEIIDFNISPDQKLIYIVTAKNGSIDEVSVRLYDFINRKMLPAPVLDLAENSMVWASPTTLFYDEKKADGSSAFAQYDTVSKTTTEIPKGGYVMSDYGNYALTVMNDQYNLRDTLHGTDTPILGEPESIVFVDDQFVYLSMSGSESGSDGESNGFGELRSFKRNSLTPDAGTVLIASTDLHIRSIKHSKNAFFVTVRNGPDRRVRVYDESGTSITEFLVPSSSSFGGASWVDPTKPTQLNVTLSSAINRSASFVYDVAAKTWDRDPETVMMELDGVSFTSSIEYATSADGTKIPVRMTYRSDIPKNGGNPAVIHSYGGFGELGYLDPAYSLTELEFLKRGGVMVGSGLRGGSEYDGKWHSQAMNAGKIKTYQDLAATAQLLVSDGLSSPSKIVSMGTSNGGLTVSATALLFPNTFGLVVAVGGVHDLLARDRLDPEFEGWDSEYGSDTDPNLLPSLTAISPLENTAAQGSTAFLIVDGASDTRVNIAHSLKLTAAFEAETSPHAAVNLYTVEDAGHWVESASYSNMKAFKAESAIWTKIYDLAGWDLSAGN